jgi:SAM-dependent methyltransferase
MTTDQFEARRAYYETELAEGLERFFEHRRESCPWCGSTALSVRLRASDMVQRKPGRFTLERCGDCGHIFQNPRLTPTGLNFYYRDFYDGLGQELMENLAAGKRRSYRGRVELVIPHTTPRTWLDVGAAYGHFCKVAREEWPDAVFDGLDQSASVVEAERRGWVNRCYQGEFTDFAAKLAGRYDVVSMHHYLEHTRDPRAELDAAARVLRPGNHLLVEMPDPDYGLAPVFGRWWFPLLQPQHQHMIPLPNLLGALRERGFEILRITRGPAHIGIDATWALVQLFAVVARDPSLPWLTEPETPARRRRHELVWKRVAPKAFQAMHHVDAALTKLAKATDDANTYRVLARRSP